MHVTILTIHAFTNKIANISVIISIRMITFVKLSQAVSNPVSGDQK